MAAANVIREERRVDGIVALKFEQELTSMLLNLHDCHESGKGPLISVF